MKIKYTNAFKRDYKRFSKKHYDMSRIDNAIIAITERNKEELIRLKDHSLLGDWAGFREMHLSSNWLRSSMIRRFIFLKNNTISSKIFVNKK